MRCPVCRNTVEPNAGGANIAAHRDTTGRICPATGYPYRITAGEVD